MEIVISDKGRGLGRKTVMLIQKKAFEELSAVHSRCSFCYGTLSFPVLLALM